MKTNLESSLEQLRHSLLDGEKDQTSGEPEERARDYYAEVQAEARKDAKEPTEAERKAEHQRGIENGIKKLLRALLPMDADTK